MVIHYIFYHNELCFMAQTAATDQFSGRLTFEFLLDKIGHKQFDQIKELNLSNWCVIFFVDIFSTCCVCLFIFVCFPSLLHTYWFSLVRSTSGLDGSRFTQLRDLNLDNNQLTDLNGISSLKALVILRANQNRLVDCCGDGTGLNGLGLLQVYMRWHCVSGDIDVSIGRIITS